MWRDSSTQPSTIFKPRFGWRWRLETVGSFAHSSKHFCVEVEASLFKRTSGDFAPRRGSRIDQISHEIEREHDARPRQKHYSGGDRRGLRTHRLFPFQFLFCVEVGGVRTDKHKHVDQSDDLSRIGGIRRRRRSIQFHRHRRQFADGAGSDGKSFFYKNLFLSILRETFRCGNRRIPPC